MSSREHQLQEWKDLRDLRADIRRDIQVHLAAIEMAKKELAETDFDWKNACEMFGDDQ